MKAMIQTTTIHAHAIITTGITTTGSTATFGSRRMIASVPEGEIMEAR
jgi:hypothetical protein